MFSCKYLSTRTTIGRMDGRTDGRTDGLTDGRMDRRMDGRNNKNLGKVITINSGQKSSKSELFSGTFGYFPYRRRRFPHMAV